MTEQTTAAPAQEPVRQNEVTSFKEVQDIARRAGQELSGKSDDEVLKWLDSGDTAADRPFEIPGSKEIPKAPEGEPQEPADADPGDEAAKAKEPEKAAGEGEDEKPADGDEPPVEEESAYETALRALRRAKTPQAVLRGMKREQVMAWGMELAKVQSVADQAFTELRELRSAKATPENQAGGQTNAPVTADATALADLTGKLSQALGLDEEGGAVLSEALKARDKLVADELARRDQRDQARDSVLANLMLEQARSQLVDRFPGLKEREKYGPVLDKARALFRGGEYESVVDAMEDASKLLLGDEIAAELAQKAAKKAAGRPTAPKGRAQPMALSYDQKLDATLRALESGQTREQAAVAGGW